MRDEETPMTRTIVTELSDGEELVVEAMPSKAIMDPREWAIEARRLALDDGDHAKRSQP